MAPLKPLLEKELLWNSAQYGFFTSAYGWFNVFLLMLILGGIILDKMGVRFTGKMATIVMVVGTVIKYWAISTDSLDNVEIIGMNGQVLIAALGFAIFGVGVEVAGITVSKIIYKWFKGRPRLALSLHDVIILKILMIDATHPCFDIAGVRIHRHEACLQETFIIIYRVHAAEERISFATPSENSHRLFELLRSPDTR